MTANERPDRYLLWSVFLISGAAIGAEMLLMRLFSVSQWHHFAYLIISVALLGYSVSGVVFSLRSPQTVESASQIYLASGMGFAVTACGAFLLAQTVPFNPLAILWDGREWLHLVAMYLILAVPFFFAANCVCLLLGFFQRQQALVYGYDLAGAGCGAAITVGLLWWLPPLGCLAVLSAAVTVAALLGWRGFGRPVDARVLAAAALILVLAALAARVPVRMSEYKSLARTLQVLGSEVIAERTSPLGALTVLANREVPLREAPGLSLNSPGTPPEQLALFSDGEGMSAITRYDGSTAAMAYLDYLPSALPYALRAEPSVLVLGAGGGGGVLSALVHNARRVDAVELNPQVVDMVRRQFGDYSGHVYDDKRVRVHVVEARRFVTSSTERYDLIELSPLDAFTTAAAGLQALSENHLYTREALREYMEHLTSRGLLALSRWAQLPPRDDLKLFATAVEVLRSLHKQPEHHLIWIRGWNISVIVVSNAPFTPVEIDAAKAFATERWFDMAWYPDMNAAEANRFNVWPEAYDYLGASALVGDEAEAFISNYKFNIRPATDDRPYFFHFFKWRLLPEVWSIGRERGMALLDLGYFVLITALLQAVVVSVILIALPVWVWQRTTAERDRRSSPYRLRGRVVIYFGAIGLGFMFVEVACIQKFMVYLHHPLYAVAVVLTGMLLFSGVGSLQVSGNIRGDMRHTVRRAVMLLIALLLVYLAALSRLFDWSGQLSDPLRIAVTLGLIAPLALAMGKPFPLGLRSVAGHDRRLVAWAFAINGCSSVVGAMLATLTMMHVGYTGAVIAATLFYAVAAWSMPQKPGSGAELGNGAV